MFPNSCCNQISRQQVCFPSAYDGCCDMMNQHSHSCDGMLQTSVNQDPCGDIFPIPSPAKMMTPYKKKKKSCKMKTSNSNRSFCTNPCVHSKPIETRDASACCTSSCSIGCECPGSGNTPASSSTQTLTVNHKQQKNSQNIQSRGLCTSRMSVIAEESETEHTKADEERKKSVQESCADFLNIVHDNVVETVQKSVDRILRDYFVHTMEKMESLCSQMLRNECMLSKMYLDIMDKLAQQDDKNLRQFKCICQFLAETRNMPETQTKSLAEVDCCEVLLRSCKTGRTSYDATSYVPVSPILSCNCPKSSQLSVTDKPQCIKQDIRRASNGSMGINDKSKPSGTGKYFSSVKSGPSNSEIPSTSQRSKS